MTKVGRVTHRVNLENPQSWPAFVKCGCCGMWHRNEYLGDCRNDNERLSLEQIYEEHGNHWREVDDGQ